MLIGRSIGWRLPRESSMARRKFSPASGPVHSRAAAARARSEHPQYVAGDAEHQNRVDVEDVVVDRIGADADEHHDRR